MRYGERTARGIVEEYNACWAFVLGERRKQRNTKRIMVSRDMVRDIASSRASAASVPKKEEQLKMTGWSVTRRVEGAVVVLRQGIRWQRLAT